MTNLSATEYEAVDLTTDIIGGEEPEKIVEKFLSLYLNEEVFYKIVIINSGYRYLRNRKNLGMKKDEKFRIIDTLKEALTLKKEIRKACCSHGHMSVLFVANISSDFSDIFLKQGFYSNGKRMILANKNDGMLSVDQKTDFINCLSSQSFGNDNYICVFSHDADYFYKIFTEDIPY